MVKGLLDAKITSYAAAESLCGAVKH